jgi:O-antigen ligase
VKPTLTNRNLSLRIRGLVHRPDRLLVVMGLVAAALAGVAIAQGGTRAAVAVTGGLAVVGITLIGALLRTRAGRDFAAVELPALLILLSQIVLRQRDAEALSSNPLDAAGLLRVASIGLAGLLGALALTTPVTDLRERITTRPFRLYCFYVVIVFLGAPLSVNLLLTAYRGVELVACLVVVAGAFRRAGRQAAERILTLVYWFTAASVVAIWLGAVVMPGSAFSPVDSPFPVQLHGVFPAFSANGTGTLGAVLGLWSLAKLLSPPDRGKITTRILLLLTVLGFTTLAFAQYRTGYLAAIVGLVVLLWFRARAAAFWVIMITLVVAIAWGGQIVHSAEPVLQRGATVEVVRGLSGRLNYWESGLEVWRESPFLGRGLLTASRFEVLAKLGSVYTSSIHGTWVEALVGTGVIGLAFLAAAFLVTMYRAFRDARRLRGLVVPLILLTFLAVRSITGPTFEVAGGDALVLMTLAILFRDQPMVRGREEPRLQRPEHATR